MQRLEAQVQALSERIAEMHLTQASYRAQVETLQSRCAAAAPSPARHVGPWRSIPGLFYEACH